MMKRLVLILVLCNVFLFNILISCKNEEQNPILLFGKKEEVENTKLKYTRLDYQHLSGKIIRDGKLKLRRTLEMIMKSEIDIMSNSIKDIDAQYVLHYSLKEAEIEINHLQIEAGISLLKNEIVINLINAEIIGQLDSLNIKFSKYFNSVTKDSVEFQNFYETDNIVFGEELIYEMYKMKENEEDRKKRKQQDEFVDGGLLAISLIPGAAAATNILSRVAKGARKFKHLSSTLKNSKFLTESMKESIKSLKGKTGDLVLSATSNLTKRNAIGKVSNNIYWGANSLKITNYAVERAQLEELFDIKDVEIEKIINAFSNGYMTRHMQSITIIAKENSMQIHI